MSSLNLRGLIHFWGPAGCGKTLLAVALASDVSKQARIDWINTDGKKSFVNYLKANIASTGGRPENVTISMVDTQAELLDVIETLPMSELPALLVIDPITRVLDLGRENPTLWGRELVEDVLPTLAGLVASNDIAIIITSESRMVEESKTQPIHHETISKWLDHDLCLSRDISSSNTHIKRKFQDSVQETAELRVDSSGLLQIIPRIYRNPIMEESM